MLPNNRPASKFMALILAGGIAIGLGTVVTAQSMAGDSIAEGTSVDRRPISAAWLTGQMLWSGEKAGDAPDSWVEAGRIDDLVISPDSGLQGYSIDMAGFLGFGAYKVMLEPEGLEFVEINGETYLVTYLSKEELQGLPQLDEASLLH